MDLTRAINFELPTHQTAPKPIPIWIGTSGVILYFFAQETPKKQVSMFNYLTSKSEKRVSTSPLKEERAIKKQKFINPSKVKSNCDEKVTEKPIKSTRTNQKSSRTSSTLTSGESDGVTKTSSKTKKNEAPTQSHENNITTDVKLACTSTTTKAKPKAEPEQRVDKELPVSKASASSSNENTGTIEAGSNRYKKFSFRPPPPASSSASKEVGAMVEKTCMSDANMDVPLPPAATHQDSDNDTDYSLSQVIVNDDDDNMYDKNKAKSNKSLVKTALNLNPESVEDHSSNRKHKPSIAASPVTSSNHRPIAAVLPQSQNYR